MPRFEVHIPSASPSDLQLTFRVDADDWMAALKLGMEKLGELAPTGQNVLVDIRADHSLHVTETRTGRVFRIRELTEEESRSARVKPTSAVRPVPAAPSTARETGPAIPYDRGVSSLPGLMRAEANTERALPPVNFPEPTDLPLHAAASPLRPAEPRSTLQRYGEGNDPDDDPTRPGIRPSPLSLALADGGRVPSGLHGVPRGLHRAQPPREVVELEEPTQIIEGPIGRTRPVIVAPAATYEERVAEVFQRSQAAYRAKDVSEAMTLLLDLALEKIAAEAGSVLELTPRSGALTFTAARGPKAKELLEAKVSVPPGRSIAGFCAFEGVSLALCDVKYDPRHYAEVADRFGYEIRSLLCVPMLAEGHTFGVMQLLNRKGSDVFEEEEVALLGYIAHQGARYLRTR